MQRIRGRTIGIGMPYAQLKFFYAWERGWWCMGIFRTCMPLDGVLELENIFA